MVESKERTAKGNKRVMTRVSPEIVEKFEEYCEKHNTTQSEVMRLLIKYLLRDKMPNDLRQRLEQVEDKPDDNKARIKVTFTQSELDAVRKLAEAELTSPQSWIIKCVRASLTHEPQHTMEVTKALWESSYQLKGIGKNLNQIAKYLNSGMGVTITTENIKALEKVIKLHTHKVDVVQEASLQRWLIREESGISEQDAETRRKKHF